MVYPQLATLATKATDNEQLWTSVVQLLNRDAFFPSDEMSISSWVKLEFTLANPDLLLSTNSPEHCAKAFPEWVQYLLHQRTETRNLAKTQRHVDTAGGVTLTSACFRSRRVPSHGRIPSIRVDDSQGHGGA